MKVSLDSTCEQSPLGLSSVAALSQLHSQLTTVLQEHQHSPKQNGDWKAAWNRCFLHHSVRWSSLHWPGALLTTLCAASLITCHFFDQNSDWTAFIGGCTLLLLLLADLVAMAALQQLKTSEMPRRVETLLNTLQDFLLHPPSGWLKDTDDLLVPSLPAVSLQWTYRDGRLVNLPVSLLVEGDIICLRPGSEAPTELRGIQEEEHVILSQSDVFSHLSSPPCPLDHERSRPHRLLQPKLFRVTRTPAVEMVQRCLELSQHRPVSVLDNERFTVQTLLERGPAPLALVVLLVLNTLRYIVGAPGIGPWHVTLLQLPVNGILPLLPLTFPLLWFLVGVYGEVRVLLQMEPQPTALWEVWKLTCRTYFSVLCGRSSALCHTASLLHNLGSLTVLCCVDKQGILSWPSPNPEKILFFSKSLSSERAKENEKGREKAEDNSTSPRPFAGLEMLSLSLDRARFDDTRVQFDDMQWERHAPSLRPIGLAIQLLLGEGTVATRMLRLSDHLTHAALLRTRPPCQPVRPPWGLCQLPKLLGFSPLAREPFQQRMSVAAYTLPTIPCSGEPGQISPPTVSMRRLPFSHLIALLVHHAHTGEFQLFSYGSADAVLSTCSEFWNGEDLQLLTDSDRKKVVDFYQRSCMAGQCVAVSFKPLLHPHDPEIDGMCVELPPSLNDEDADDVLLSPLKQQVFLGLVSSQYQVRPDMVRLISGLDSACIRFVYFSNEEEVRSKVFAEKMGLETGWNCHISLQSECFLLDPDNIHLTEPVDEESHLMGECVREEAESRSMDHESTCLIEDLNRAKLPKGIEKVRPHLENIDNVPLLVPLFTDCTPQKESHLMGECVREEAESRSMDHESTCLIEDLNRAKLPKGIEKVRPHLENIDNVPLLVPLFTDCTPQTECEMVCIMQEYGEVVCCLGSSQNVNNNTIFLQSDISIALEPLVPVCCPSRNHAHPRTPGHSAGAGLTQLSSAICGLACTVQLQQQDNNVIIKLIRQARHTTAGIRKCFLFLLQCQLSLVLIQILACICQLPPPLATSDVLLLSCCYYPLLSVSLLGKPSDSSIMKVPTGKNLRFRTKKMLRFFMLCFSVKFGLTVCIYLTCFGLLLHAFCLEINHEDEKLCHPTALLTNSTVWSPDWYGKHSDGLSLGQKLIASLTLLYAICTSVSHVHRSAPLWKQNPLSNQSWCAVVCTLPILCVSTATGSRLLWHDHAPHRTFGISDVPLVTWLLGFLWLLPLTFINEGMKLQEIRMRVRYQKRQKLQFDTKLGMNSPF